MIIWYLFWYYTIPQSAKSHKATISLQPPHTFTQVVLLIHELIGQWSQIDLGIKKREAAHHYLQWNQVFFSQVYLILLSGHLFLLPPSVVGSVVAWDTWYFVVCLSIRKGALWAYKPNLYIQGVEFHFKLFSNWNSPLGQGITFPASIVWW